MTAELTVARIVETAGSLVEVRVLPDEMKVIHVFDDAGWAVRSSRWRRRRRKDNFAERLATVARCPPAEAESLIEWLATASGKRVIEVDCKVEDGANHLENSPRRSAASRVARLVLLPLLLLFYALVGAALWSDFRRNKAWARRAVRTASGWVTLVWVNLGTLGEYLRVEAHDETGQLVRSGGGPFATSEKLSAAIVAVVGLASDEAQALAREFLDGRRAHTLAFPRRSWSDRLRRSPTVDWGGRA